MTEPHDLTACEQAAAIRRREISPVELLDHYLGRIERLNDRVGAYVTVTDELAREEAKAAEQRVLAAEDPDQLPPLLGVPVPIKDLNMVTGVRSTMGSLAYSEFVAFWDDDVVANIRSAGAVMIGKTNTPEFGLPCYTENAVAPPARTPWDLDRSAGGSSGGAAAAVAAGLAPVAHANDGAGSIRIPASVCGLFGIKTSRGRVSNGPYYGDVAGLAVQGPLARTVADAAALLDAMAGPSVGDPHWAPPPPDGETFSAAVGRDPGRLRIGRFTASAVAGAEPHPDCLAAYEAATELLVELGHEVEDVAPPFGAELVPVFERVWTVSSTLTPVAPEDEERLLPLTRHLRERGRQVSATDFATAIGDIQRACRAWLEAIRGYDAILNPTLAQPPALVGGLRHDADPALDFENQKRFTPYTVTYNATGQPAVSLPLHWTGAGLPIGVMLAGRQAGEAQLIALSAQLEAARPWSHRKPPLW
jgi:amidase